MGTWKEGGVRQSLELSCAMSWILVGEQGAETGLCYVMEVEVV